MPDLCNTFGVDVGVAVGIGVGNGAGIVPFFLMSRCVYCWW